MSYDPYDAPSRSTSKRYYREERRDDRDPRYVETRDSYLNAPSRDLIPRPREDSDLSVEEIRRDFPPPGYSSRDVRRARSAEPGYYDEYDDRRSHSHHDRDYDRRPAKKSESMYYEEERKKARMISKQEQIIAAITGAAIAIGGKELYDRRDAKVHDSEIQRNVLTSAALGAAGAFAGYSGTELYNKRKEKEGKKSTYAVYRGRDGKVAEYYSDDEEEGANHKKGNKNFLEAALAAAGLGSAVKALTGGSGKDDKSDTRSRRGSRESSRSRNKGDKGKGDGANKIQKAAMASLIAGATEAFRVSREPGSWKGEKAKRILTAAAGAATIDAAQKSDKAGSKLGLAESVIGGLLGNRVINGSKKNIEEDEKTGRSRSRSRARSASGGGAGGVTGLAALATAGLGALGAKKIIDNRSRSRSRRPSADSRDGSPDRPRRSRSRSVVDKARKGLAKLGIGKDPEDEDDDSDDHRKNSRRDQDDYDEPKKSRRHRDSYDDRDRDRGQRRSGGRDDSDDDDRDYHGRDHSRQRGDRDRGTVARRGSNASSTDLGDSDEDNKLGKKMRGKQIITTGLATVATIHAAANVYNSMEKRKKRQKAVREGRLSPEEAKKLKSKAILQDAASVGIAALGIKGAISELKEAREVRHEMLEWREKKEERHNRRLQRQRQLQGGSDGDSDSNGGGDGGRGGDGSGRSRSRQRADNWSLAAPPKADRFGEDRLGDGPRYTDGNPYAASR